jgi:hypothetical protein
MRLSSVQKSILINLLIGAFLLALVAYVLWVRKLEVVKQTAVDFIVPLDEDSIETVFIAEDVTGIRRDKSPVICRGVRIGVIERVGKPQLKPDGTIEIRLVARIQKDYGGKDWRFSNEARLQSSALTGGFLAAGIELIFDPVDGYNLIGHEFRIAPAKQSVDDATEAVRDLSRSIQRTFDQLNAPADDLSAGPETKLDRLLETWRVVAERLSKELDRSDDDSLIATSRVVAERLGKELDRSDGDSLIAKSRLLVDQTGNFFRSSDKRFDEVHDDLRDVFGETPSERRALRRKANELLDSADALTSRVGDTFMGRLLIRSEQKKAKEAERLRAVPSQEKRKQSVSRESGAGR